MMPLENDLLTIEEYITAYRQNIGFEGKVVAVFGCNAYTKSIRDILAKNEIKLSVILDNDVRKQNKISLGILMRSPEEVVREEKDLVVIIYSGYCNEMVKQLEELGVYKENILAIPFRPFKRGKYDESLEGMKEKYIEVCHGYEIYTGIMSELSVEYLFVCPYKGTGDVYHAVSFLDRYAKERGIINYGVLVMSNAGAKVVQLFGFDKVYVLKSEEDMVYLLGAWVFWGEEKMKMKPIRHCGWRWKMSPWVFGKDDVTFLDMFRSDVFGFSENVEPALPRKNGNIKYIEQLFFNNGLSKGRTVILSPYANSVEPEMTYDIWGMLADKIKEAGFDVCTNCVGEELPIKGTKPLAFSYADAIDVLEYAGFFVGIRSGLCDIVSSAKCKMIIVYENGIRALNYNFFGLSTMGLNREEIPIIYSSVEDIDNIVRELRN